MADEQPDSAQQDELTEEQAAELVARMLAEDSTDAGDDNRPDTVSDEATADDGEVGAPDAHGVDSTEPGRTRSGMFAAGNQIGTSAAREAAKRRRKEAEKPLTAHRLLAEMQAATRTRDRVDVRRLMRNALAKQLNKAANGDRHALKLLTDLLTAERRLEVDRANGVEMPSITVITGVPAPDPAARIEATAQAMGRDRPRLTDDDAIERLGLAAPSAPRPLATEIQLTGRPDPFFEEPKTWTQIMGIDAALARRRQQEQEQEQEK